MSYIRQRQKMVQNSQFYWTGEKEKNRTIFCFAEEHTMYLVVSWFMLGYEYGKFGREKRRQNDGF